MSEAVVQLLFVPRGLGVLLDEGFLSVAERDHVTLCMYVVGHEQHMAGLRMMMQEVIT